MSNHFVSIIGSGNVAWHLAPALDNAGFVVKEVYSRNPRHAEALTERLYQAEVKASLDFSTSASTIIIIAVSDDAIQDIVREIILPEDVILIHTSGSQPLSVLNFSATPRTGVFYPLQSFSPGRKLDFGKIPVFVESEDEETEVVLQQMGAAISNSVRLIDSPQRKALHVAAVFASNFCNHMLTLSEDIMDASKLDFAWLTPLIHETISKALALGPDKSQTGPAKRGDFKILDQHMEFLKDEKTISEIYKVVSQSIVDRYDL